MLGLRLIATGAAVMALMSACEGEAAPSGGPDEPEMSAELEEAVAELRTTVDELVAEVASGAEASPRSDNDRLLPCNGGGDEYRAQLGYVVDAGDEDPTIMLHRAHVIFADQGMDVDLARLEADPPAVLAEADGFSYSAVVSSPRRVVLAGTTPCYG